DFHVTGVQTCALPIFTGLGSRAGLVELPTVGGGKIPGIPGAGAWAEVTNGTPMSIAASPIVKTRCPRVIAALPQRATARGGERRSEEHTSELQSRGNL